MKKNTRKNQCGACGRLGHNRRSCAQVERHPGRRVMGDTQGSDQVVAWAAEALGLMGCPELLPIIEFKWNKRLVTTFGRAVRTRSVNPLIPPRYRLEISSVLWAVAPEEERKQVVVHETAHLVDMFQGTFCSKQSHGPRWAWLMRLAGHRPTRCHQIEAPQNARRRAQKRYPVVCGCENPRGASGVIRARMLRGRVYKCRPCGRVVALKK